MCDIYIYIYIYHIELISYVNNFEEGKNAGENSGSDLENLD
jgi:hypothetical protein